MADDEIVQVERSGKRQKVKKKGGGVLCKEGGTMMSNGGSSSKGGSKDRHSKVRTSRGLRDRRVRLSPTCALRLFDIQDRLGFDQPSKAVDWLLDKAQRAIHQLPAPPAPLLGGPSDPAPLGLPDLEQQPPPHQPKPDPAPSHDYDTLSLTLSSSSNAALSLSTLNRSNRHSTTPHHHDIKEESLPISRCDHHHHLRPASPGHLRALLL